MIVSAENVKIDLGTKRCLSRILEAHEYYMTAKHVSLSKETTFLTIS